MTTIIPHIHSHTHDAHATPRLLAYWIECMQLPYAAAYRAVAVNYTHTHQASVWGSIGLRPQCDITLTSSLDTHTQCRFYIQRSGVRRPRPWIYRQTEVRVASLCIELWFRSAPRSWSLPRALFSTWWLSKIVKGLAVANAKIIRTRQVKRCCDSEWNLYNTTAAFPFYEHKVNGVF